MQALPCASFTSPVASSATSSARDERSLILDLAYAIGDGGTSNLSPFPPPIWDPELATCYGADATAVRNGSNTLLHLNSRGLREFMHADPSPGLHSRTARAWLWAGLWGLFVWGLGGEELSSASTSRFLGPMIRWLLAGISYADSQLLQFYIRKTAHAVEYALLAVLILRALRTGRRPTLIGASLAALGLATAFAAADETRQSLSTVRMGSVFDVALDGTGAAVGIGLLLLFWSRAGPPRVGQATRSRGSEKAASADDMHTGTSE